MAANTVSASIQRVLKEFVQGIYDPSSQTIDVANFLKTHFGGKQTAEEAHAQIAKLENFLNETHVAFVETLPFFHEVNKFEVYQLHRLSERFIPYWFAAEKFNFDESIPCGTNTPYMCFSPNSLAIIYAWQQIAAFAVGTFLMILLGGVAAAICTRKKLHDRFPQRLAIVLLCFLLDVIGLASLLLPAAGNVVDVIWAPIAGIISATILRSPKGGFLVFVKEMLPLCDLVPLASLIAIGQLFDRNKP